MNTWARLATKLYRLLLAGYPEKFRSEFGAEMQDVFGTVLEDAQRASGERPWQLFWRELRDWPRTIVREHLQARRRKMPSNGFVDEKPLQRSELLAAMMIFLIPMFSIFLTTGIRLPNWADILLVFLFWGCIIFAVGLAVARRLPRWSLSYMGVLMMIGFVFVRFDRVWTWTFPYFIQAFGPRSAWPLGVRIIYSGGGALSTTFSILVSALILVSVLRLFPITRKIWHRIRRDLTQLSFLIYGSLVFFIIIAFEEFQYDEIPKFIAWSCLALGAWLYLRSRGKRQRMLALIGGATGGMWVIAISYWVLIPLQDWQSRYSLISMRDLRWTDTSTAIIGWICILLAMMAPALLNLLPIQQRSDIQEDNAPS